jgi:lipopolysaccharide transport system permease protein
MTAPPAQEPVTTICPEHGRAGVDLRELWRFRELFGFLVWRDIKVQYKQTLLGALWAVLVPLLQMAIFAAISRIANLPSDGVPRPVFYFTNMVAWSFFAVAVTRSSQSLVGSAQLLTKTYFPRLIVPTGACIAGLVDFAIAFLALLCLMLAYGIVPPAAGLLCPLLMLVALGTSVGLGLLLSALNVRYRDVRYVVGPLLQMWMFCTVLLPFSKIPHSLGPWRYLYGLNPMAGVIEGFRWCLLHQRLAVEEKTRVLLDSRLVPETLAAGQSVAVRVVDGATQVWLEQTTQAPVGPPWMLLAVGVPVMVLLLGVGLLYFRRTERFFADIV